MTDLKPFFVHVNHIDERFDFVTVRRAALFLAHLEPRMGRLVTGQRAAQQVLQMRRFVGRGLFDIGADPVAYLAVGDGILSAEQGQMPETG